MPNDSAMTISGDVRIHWPMITFVWGSVIFGFLRLTVKIGPHVHRETTCVLNIGRWLWQWNSSGRRIWSRNAEVA